MQDCVKVTELIPLFIANELDEEERGQAEKHLFSCESCRFLYEDMRKILATLYSIEGEELPEGFHDEFMNKLHNEPKSKPAFMSWNYKAMMQAAACAAAVLIALSAMFVGISELAGFDRPAAVKDISEASLAATESKVNSDETPDSQIDSGSAAFSAPVAAIEDDAARSAEPSTSDSASFVTHYTIELYVDDIKSAMDQISKLNGAQESMDYTIPAYEGDHGYAFIIRRAPSQEFDIIKDQLRSIGDINNEYESKQSMSRQLRDLNARLLAKNEEKDRLLDLLGKSGDLDVMVRIESRLSSVSYESESLYSQIRSINHEIGRPYLNIRLYNRVYVPPLPPKQALGTRMANSFKQSVNDTVRFMQGLLLFVVSAAIPVSVLIIIGVLFYLLYKLVFKRRRSQ